MDLSQQLFSIFGHREFRGIQREVIVRVLSGRNSMLVMPTGGGKSLCYQLPAILLQQQASQTDDANCKPPLTLVISPLIALMKDQVDALVEQGIDAAFVNSSLTKQQRNERYRRLAEGGFTILYVTPERFRKSEFREVLAKRDIVLLAVDEAHCISEWGHDFRPDYTCVGEFREWIGDPPTIALTATATRDVQLDIAKQLNLGELGRDNDCECQLFHTGIARPNLNLTVQEVWGTDAKLDGILEELTRWNRKGNGIVYFTLIRTLEEFSQRLQQHDIPHLAYHGDLPRRVRRQSQEEFINGENVLVLATNAFGMGVDKKNIRFVIHAEVPSSIEAYYQEIGRAGRDGKPSNCLLLYDQQDLMTQMEFIRWSNPDADFYARTYDLIVNQFEQVRAFGYEWLHEKLCHKQRQDRRLGTVLAMLERYGVLEGADIRNDTEDADWSDLSLGLPLPEELTSHEFLAKKLDRDQRKLLSLVQYVQAEDRIAYLENYFGLD